MSHGVKLDMTALIALPERFQAATQTAVDKTLEQAKQIAQGYAAVDTTSMREGVYTSSATGSGYAEAAAAAESVNPGVELLPEVPQPPPGEGTLSDAVAHSLFIEFGTTRMSARPFMAPASIEAEAIYITNLEDAVRAIESELPQA